MTYKIGDLVKIHTPAHPHEIKYIGEVGKVHDILGTSTGDDGKQEQILVVEVMGLREVFFENQIQSEIYKEAGWREYERP